MLESPTVILRHKIYMYYDCMSNVKDALSTALNNRRMCVLQVITPMQHSTTVHTKGLDIWTVGITWLPHPCWGVMQYTRASIDAFHDIYIVKFLYINFHVVK